MPVMHSEKEMVSCWSSNSANINCWLPPSYINITDSLVIPARATCDNVKIVRVGGKAV